MAKISLAGFRDPARRPRYILWTLAAVFGLVAFMIVALGVTSSYWFCAEVCHKVQDDTITAYQNSTHNKVNWATSDWLPSSSAPSLAWLVGSASFSCLCGSTISLCP